MRSGDPDPLTVWVWAGYHWASVSFPSVSCFLLYAPLVLLSEPPCVLIFLQKTPKNLLCVLVCLWLFLWYFTCWKLIKNDGGKFPFIGMFCCFFYGFLCVIFSSNSRHMILVFGFDPMVIYPCSHNSSLDCVEFDAFVIFSTLLKLEFCDILQFC